MCSSCLSDSHIWLFSLILLTCLIDKLMLQGENVFWSLKLFLKRLQYKESTEHLLLHLEALEFNFLMFTNNNIDVC